MYRMGFSQKSLEILNSDHNNTITDASESRTNNWIKHRLLKIGNPNWIREDFTSKEKTFPAYQPVNNNYCVQSFECFLTHEKFDLQ